MEKGTTPFNQAVSKLTVSKELTQVPPTIKRVCLDWCMANYGDLRHTDLKTLAVMMAGRNGISQKSFYAALLTMKHQNILVSPSKKGNKAKRDFYINFFHPLVPPEIIDMATPEQLAEVKLLVYGNKPMPEEMTKDTPALQELVEPVEETPTTPSVDIPIQLDKLPNGNFTLQLNINFTINGGK